MSGGEDVNPIAGLRRKNGSGVGIVLREVAPTKAWELEEAPARVGNRKEVRTS